MATETGQIYIFDLESNTLASTYTSHAMSVRSLSWSPDCQVRASSRPLFVHSFPNPSTASPFRI